LARPAGAGRLPAVRGRAAWFPPRRQHSAGARRRALFLCIRGFPYRPEFLEHDPEKWAPVFGKDHAQIIRGRRSGEPASRLLQGARHFHPQGETAGNSMRKGSIKRTTKETDVEVAVDLDG